MLLPQSGQAENRPPEAQISPTTQVVAEVETDPIPALIVRYSAEYGVSEQTALAIAKCESGLRQFRDDGSVLLGVVNPQDIGLFQINEYYHLETAERMGLDIYNTDGNIRYAMWLLKTQGTRPWIWSERCWSDGLVQKK